MEENQDYEKIENDIRKIEYNLENTEMEVSDRLLLLNILRYDKSLIEDRDKVCKVKYDYSTKNLKTVESIQIGIAISLNVNKAIKDEANLEVQRKLYQAMKETYYYLARYLFEYYLPAMEFGIAPEKQFIAPRTMVLNALAREYTKFYYRTDNPIMTVSMPQGTRKDGDRKEIFKLEHRKRSRTTINVCKLFSSDSKRQRVQWNRCLNK